MRLVCPSCAIEYEVPSSAVGERGRMVQCGACDELWFQASEEASSSADAPPSIGAAPGAPEKAPEPKPSAFSEGKPASAPHSEERKAATSKSGEAAPLYGRASDMPHSVNKTEGKGPELPSPKAPTPARPLENGGKESAVSTNEAPKKPVSDSPVEKPAVTGGVFAPSPSTPKAPQPATPPPVGQARPATPSAATRPQTPDAKLNGDKVAGMPQGPAAERHDAPDAEAASPLRASAEPKDEADILAASIMEDEAPSYRSAHAAFVSGFAVVMLMALILAGVYLKAADISALMPAVAEPLTAFTDLVDRARVALADFVERK